jgi:hypothetical protein
MTSIILEHTWRNIHCIKQQHCTTHSNLSTKLTLLEFDQSRYHWRVPIPLASEMVPIRKIWNALVFTQTNKEQQDSHIFDNSAISVGICPIKVLLERSKVSGEGNNKWMLEQTSTHQICNNIRLTQAGNQTNLNWDRARQTIAVEKQ